MRLLHRAVLACALVGCEQSLDRDKLVGDIKSTLADKHVAEATVECPEVKKLEAGKKFQCTGAAFGKPFKVDVVVTDDKGTVKWDLVGKIVATEKLAAFVQPKISDKLGTPAVVSCAQKQAILAAKDSITCDVTIDGKASHVAITVADNGDDINWELAP